MIRVYHIGTTTVQGPDDDMPRPFDPATHIPPQERAAQARDAVSADADSHGATSPSKAGHSEAEGHLQNANDGAHNADRAQIAALGADPVPADRRSPMEHERDAVDASAAPDPVANASCRQPIDPAGEVEWLRKIGINTAADLIEALVAECSREFGRGYEVGRAVGAVEGPRPMTEGKA